MRLTLILIAALAACGVLAALGTVERNVSLDSVAGLWADVLRDADTLALKPLHVSTAREVEFGRRLDAAFPHVPFPGGGAARVSAIGARLEPFLSRRGVPYTFRAVSDPNINAFAIAGGFVYITSGMLQFVQSDAELAFVLGHEISHIDQRHCVQRHKLAARLGSDAAIVDLLRRVLGAAYDQQQESDADSQAVRMMIQAGYDPTAAVNLMQRLEAPRHALYSLTPDAELARSLAGLLQSYWATHPPAIQRANRLARLAARRI